jgi:heme exporter protein CcmD
MMQSWSQFWAMGGYGAFIWPAYMATCLGLGLFAWLNAQRTRRLQRLAAAQRQRLRAPKTAGQQLSESKLEGPKVQEMQP